MQYIHQYLGIIIISEDKKQGPKKFQPLLTASIISKTNSLQIFIHKCHNSSFHFILDCSIVVNFMAVSGIQFGLYRMSGLVQPVCNLINTFSIVSNRVLISGNIVYREIFWNFLSPPCSGDFCHHLGKIKHGLIGGRFRECIKRKIRKLSMKKACLADGISLDKIQNGCYNKSAALII